MTFFSRCDAAQRFEPAFQSRAARRTRIPQAESHLFTALSGFAEDLGILIRYAAGLDYYSRDRQQQGH